MPELPNDYTDKLFQEGSNQFDYTYNKNAWSQMEEMLDQESKKRRSIAALNYVMLGVLLVSLILIGVNRIDDTATTKSTAPLKQLSPFASESSNINQTKEDNDSSFVEGDSKVTHKAESTKLIEEQKPHQESLKGRLGEKQELDQPIASNQDAIKGLNARFSVASISTSKSEAAVIIESIDDKDLPTGNGEDSKETEPIKQLIKSESISVEPSKEPAKAVSIEIRNIVTRKIRNVYSIEIKDNLLENYLQLIGLSKPTKFNPLLSKISLNAQGGLFYGYTSELGIGIPRTRFSLGATYALSDKVTIGTGLSINNLCYVTNGSGYRTKQTSWFGGVSPSKIRAQCQILELPLEGTYHFGNRKNSGFYVKGGLLSYFMLSEAYDYSYEDAIIPSGVEVESLRVGWNEKNTNQHLMGIAQMSIGYQIATSPTRQLQIEGFIHAPLTGVGHGQVRVWSFGINTAIILNLN